MCRPYYYKSEVETDGSKEGTSTRGVEIVVRDVRQSEVIAEFRIDEVILKTATDPDTAVEALESLFAVEGAVGLAMSEVLDLSRNA